jgi:antitoxin HigA-1
MFVVRRQRTHPGTILRKHYLAPRGISLGGFERTTRLPRTYLTMLAKGVGSISPGSAGRIAEALGTSAQLWLNLQSEYESGQRCGARRRRPT